MRRWRRSCHQSRAAVTACVQIGHKGRFAFFRLAIEPRNHAVSFRPFQSDRALCFRFGHRARLRGLSGHRAPPYPDAYPDQTRFRHQASLARVAGPSAGPILCCAAGDIPRGRVQPRTGRGHPTPPGTGIRSPDARDAPARKETSPAAPDVPVGGQAQARGVRPGSGPRCVQAQARGVRLSSGLRAPRFRLGRAARPGQLAHAGSPRRAVGPAPGRCSPHAWPQHRRRPPVVRRSARSTALAP